MKESHKQRLLLLILILAAAPYFVGLGASSLWDSNEAFYAETPRVMIETGDFVSPSFNDQPRFNKPPLSYWIVAAFYKIFGVSELTERLPIALGALLMIAIAYGLGRMSCSVEAGLLAAVALAIAPRFLMFSRRIIIDVYVAMFMSAALLFFALAETRPHRRRIYLALMYAAIGLGVLTKGPVAAALPALCFIIYLAVTRNLRRLGEMMIPMGALIVAAIVLPWYIAVYADHGWHYIETFILKDNLSRYTEPVWGPRRGFFFYVPVLLGDMFPWSLFLIPALWLAIKRIIGKRGFSFKSVRAKFADKTSPKNDATQAPSKEQPRITLLLVIWIVAVVAFYSLSSNKEDLYILPVYTAAAAIAGGLLARFINEKLSREAVIVTRWTAATIALLIAIAGGVVLYLFTGAMIDYELRGVKEIAAIAIAGGFIALIAIFMKRDFAATLATALAMIAMNLIFVARVLPDFERYRPARAMAEIIRAEAAPDALVGYYRFAAPSLAFYLRRPIFEYYRPEELQAALESGRQVYCLISEQDYEALKDGLPAPTYVLASRAVFQVKFRVIFDRIELPRVLLISNKDGADRAR